MTMRVLLFLLSLLLLPLTASAQGGLGFTINDVFANQGDMFTISATIFNPSDSTQSYTVNSYTLDEPGGLLNYFDVNHGPDYSLLLGDSPMGRTYMPNDTASGQFLTFVPSGNAPAGDYIVTAKLYNYNTVNNDPGPVIAQTSFNVHIHAVPEFGTTLSVAGLLGAGGYGLYRQRRRGKAAPVEETPRA